MMNKEQLTNVIADGGRRRSADGEIADAVLDLAENDATWAKAFSHPARGGILALTRRDGSLSPAGAARELDRSVGVIAYHFRQLYKLGFIKIFNTVQRRGATEHVYRLTALLETRADPPDPCAARSASVKRCHSGLSSRQPSSSRRNFQ